MAPDLSGAWYQITNEMSKAKKGPAWEREFAKNLSLWWTSGRDDDIFWRSQTSGARATTRAKKGKRTSNQNGDITATDPSGQPLIDRVTFELKRGYSKNSVQDLIDSPHPWTTEIGKFIQQAKNQAIAAGTDEWALVIRRDRRRPLIIHTWRMYRTIATAAPSRMMKLRHEIQVQGRGMQLDLSLIAVCDLDDWFSTINPLMIQELDAK